MKDHIARKLENAYKDDKTGNKISWKAAFIHFRKKENLKKGIMLNCNSLNNCAVPSNCSNAIKQWKLCKRMGGVGECRP